MEAIMKKKMPMMDEDKKMPGKGKAKGKFVPPWLVKKEDKDKKPVKKKAGK
jgi:hypothetical protein